MHSHVEADSACTVLRPAGPRLDAAAAPSFKGSVIDALAVGRQRLVVDLSAIEMVDSSGLGALINAHKSVGSGGRLVVCGASPKVLALFKLTRLDKVFTLSATLPEARAAALA